jgi:hypothetical protein
MRETRLVLLLWTLAAPAGATTPPVCNGTVTYCRPCSASDDGQAEGCNGATPLCETNEESARFGSCVECTSDASCASDKPICTTAGPSADSCQACGSDAECSINPAGTHCLASGACGQLSSTAPSNSPSSCSATSAQPSSFAGILLLAILLRRRPSGPLPLTVTRSLPESLASARLHASPSRSPASDAMRSANRCP